MAETLTKIYNTLLLIETRGESTILMGQCLQALSAVIGQMNMPQYPPEVIEEKE